MFVVGLTGGIGSGKSEVSRRFQELGIHVVDADLVARLVVEPQAPALAAIQEHFGSDIINADGSLNRAKLRSIIFSDSNEKIWLESLLHPLIRNEILRQLQESSSAYTILSSPLLLETTQYQIANRILVVDASEDLQIARASTRDNAASEHIKSIMQSQLSRTDRCAKADDIIHNDGDLIDLDRQIAQLHAHYLKLAKTHD